MMPLPCEATSAEHTWLMMCVISGSDRPPVRRRLSRLWPSSASIIRYGGRPGTLSRWPKSMIEMMLGCPISAAALASWKKRAT